MRIPSDIFDPTHYADTRLRLDKAQTLPYWTYTSSEWFDREVERLLRPAWHFVGLASSIPDPGDFRTVELLGQPIIVTRADDGKVNAFRNSCRHRNSLIVAEATGTCRAFRCPYHSWTYALDGALLHAPGLDLRTRDELAGLGRDLVEVACEVRENLVFVNLEGDDPNRSVDEHLGNYTESVAGPHQVAQMVPVREREYVLASNWKLYAEVDMETLHTNHIHRSSIGEQPVTAVDAAGEWIGVYHECDHTPALKPAERGHALPPTPGLRGPAAHGAHFCIVLPGCFIVTAQDMMWWIHKLPEAPDRTRVRVGYAFPEPTLRRPDFAEVSRRYFERLDQVVDEDDWITEHQHRGLHGSSPGCYVPEESVVHRFDNWVLDRMLDG